MKFETYEAKPGDFRWRVRDDKGAVVTIRRGKIMGLGKASELRTSAEAVNKVLGRLTGKNGKARPRPAAKARGA